MDFTTYPRLTGSDPWPTTRAPDQISGSKVTSTGKFLQHPWRKIASPPPRFGTWSAAILVPLFLREKVSPEPRFPSVLSLMSNQSRGKSRDRSLNPGANNFIYASGAASHFSSTLWGFKGNEAGGGSHEVEQPDLGLRQLSQAANNPYSGGLDLLQQSGRQYMEIEHSRAYDSSTEHIHWFP